MKLLKAMGEAATCVGHDIHRFDIPFLLAECHCLGEAPPDCTDCNATAALFKGWRLGLPRKSTETCRGYAHRVLSKRAAGRKYSIPAATRPLHEAGHDARPTHLIFQAFQKTVQVPNAAAQGPLPERATRSDPRPQPPAVGGTRDDPEPTSRGTGSRAKRPTPLTTTR